MSDEYIEKEDAIQSIIAHDLVGGDARDWAEYLLENTSTADVAPVRHGRWEAIEWGTDRSGAIIIGTAYQCSECGRIIDLENDETLNDYPYCHCGAKMDEEETPDATDFCSFGERKNNG